MSSKRYPVGNEEEFNKFIVREYLKYGSVDEVYRKNDYLTFSKSPFLPIPEAKSEYIGTLI